MYLPIIVNVLSYLQGFRSMIETLRKYDISAVETRFVISIKCTRKKVLDYSAIHVFFISM